MRYLRCYAARRMHAQVKSVTSALRFVILRGDQLILDERKNLKWITSPWQFVGIDPRTAEIASAKRLSL
jgi:hypothetical protein